MSGPAEVVISIPVRVEVDPVQQRFRPYSNVFIFTGRLGLLLAATYMVYE